MKHPSWLVWSRLEGSRSFRGCWGYTTSRFSSPPGFNRLLFEHLGFCSGPFLPTPSLPLSPTHPCPPPSPPPSPPRQRSPRASRRFGGGQRRRRPRRRPSRPGRRRRRRRRRRWWRTDSDRADARLRARGEGRPGGGGGGGKEFCRGRPGDGGEGVYFFGFSPPTVTRLEKTTLVSVDLSVHSLLGIHFFFEHRVNLHVHSSTFGLGEAAGDAWHRCQDGPLPGHLGRGAPGDRSEARRKQRKEGDSGLRWVWWAQSAARVFCFVFVFCGAAPGGPDDPHSVKYEIGGGGGPMYGSISFVRGRLEKWNWGPPTPLPGDPPGKPRGSNTAFEEANAVKILELAKARGRELQKGGGRKTIGGRNRCRHRGSPSFKSRRGTVCLKEGRGVVLVFVFCVFFLGGREGGSERA